MRAARSRDDHHVHVLAGEGGRQFRVRSAWATCTLRDRPGVGRVAADERDQPRPRDVGQRPRVKAGDHPTTDNGETQHD